jgi:hypothetical protein
MKHFVYQFQPGDAHITYLCLCFLLVFHVSASRAGNGDQGLVSDQLNKTEQPNYDIDASVVIGAGATLIEGHLNYALTSLRLIAASPSTRSGIWPEIKTGLQTLSEAIPGAALYIEPDGGYYNAEKGYTGLNLSDRDYFRPLFAGREIHGALIHSRSTGKNSVLIAVPVFENDEVTGAVALSIFLDDFQELISESLNLPSDYLWYVLNEHGNTVLHPRSDFVFMNPKEQGGPSMLQAVQTITTEEEGYTSYYFAGRKTHILFKKIPFNNWRIVLGKIGEKQADEHMPEAYEILEELKTAIITHLKKIDESADVFVSSLNGRFPPEHIARSGFKRIYENNQFVVSCSLIDAEGTIIYSEPPDFYPSQGTSIRDQENFFVMQKNKAPMLSSSFLAVEGFDAVCIQHPITDDRGTFFGSVSLLIRPDIMIEEIAAPYVAETIFEPWIIEPDGRIIFDKSFNGTGKMLFLDYIFEEMKTLLELGKEISSNPTGQSDYVFSQPGSDDKSIKMAIWDTLSLHKTQWRVIISYQPYD